MAKHSVDNDLISSGLSTTIIYASGAVLWRHVNDSVEIAVIHRPRYDDWSLPKGKVDPGELKAATAVREIYEETGYRVHLGQFLGVISYPVEQGIKNVSYWEACVVEGKFAINDEVDQLCWLPIDQALTRLDYPYDRTIVTRFARQHHDTHTLLLIRHAVAGQRGQFPDDDTLRPLDKKGRSQAKALVAQCQAFGVNRIYAGERLRCIQTMEPLAAQLGLQICIEPLLTEESYRCNPQQVHQRILEIARLDGVPAICTQGGVIPDLLQWWCQRDGLPVCQSANRKASTWVLSLVGTRLVNTHYLDSPHRKRSH